jgi:hypothetical protein
VGLSNVLHTGLLGVLGEVLGGSPGLENWRRGELGDGDPADGLAWPTRGRASSLGARERARCAQTAMDTSGANCSSSAAMVVAVGLGVSREKG